MPRRKYMLIPTFIAIMLALVPVFFSPRPAGAMVELHAGKGEAVWFYRSCTPTNPSAAAIWAVDLNPSLSGGSSLKFQVNNAYPGYQLVCELSFANTGRLPITVKTISVYNPNAADLALSAVTAAGEQKKILQPCNSKPGWGKNPASLPSKCWSKVKLVLTIGPKAKENFQMDFSVQVRLEEKLNH